MRKIKISTLKNQGAFDLANKFGKKQSGRFFILVSHMPANNSAPNDNKQNQTIQPLIQSPGTLSLTHSIDSSLNCHESSKNDSKTIDKSTKIIYLGLKVSKKMGNAVVRNKIRRRIKHMFRSVAKKLPTEMWESRVYVMIPKRGFDESIYHEILKDLMWHVKKISMA